MMWIAIAQIVTGLIVLAVILALPFLFRKRE